MSAKTAKKKATAAPATEAKVVEELPQHEDRIDEHAINMFGHLGYKGRLPDKMVQIYNDFKRVKDRLSPGRLSAEGFAMVVTLSGLVE